MALLSCAVAVAPARAEQAASPQTASFTLDGVGVTVTSAAMPSTAFTVASPTAVEQTAVSSSVDPYRDFTVEEIPYGTKSYGEGLPAAVQGVAPTYRSALSSQRQSEGGTPQPAPSIDLFGVTTAGTVSQVPLAVTTAGKVPVAVAEWVGEAGSALWIVRADQQLTGQETTASFAALVAGTSVTSSTVAATPSPSPSTSASPAAPTPSATPVAPSPSATAPSPSPSPAPTPSATAVPATTDSAHVTAATGTNAPWWNGVCDVGRNGDGYPLGAVFQGFAACGPRPYTESPAGAEDYDVQFYPGAWGELEFECVELVMRYLYLTYGIAPYQANGNQTVTNYSGTQLTKIANGTTGQSPQPGDIISFGADTADGHTAVVTGNQVNASGNGTITVIEQNNAASGSNTLTVSNWVVGPDAYPTIGWLHSLASGGPTVGVNQSSGEQYLFWRSSDGKLSERSGGRAAWDGPASLPMGQLGSVATAGVHANGEEDLFWRGTTGDLWEAFNVAGRWYGPYDQGPGWGLTTQPSVAVNQRNGQEYVFWQGTGGGLEEAFWDGSKWNGPLSLNVGLLGSAPTAGVQADGEEDVFWKGTNGDLWETFWSGTRWYGPYDQGPGWGVASQPSVAVNQSNGDQYVFWQGAGGGLEEAAWNGSGWKGPTALAMGTLGSAPTAGVQANGQIDVFWRGGTGDLWEAFNVGGTWYGPYDQGSAWYLDSSPAVAVDQSDGRQYVFWLGSGSALQEAFWNNAAGWSAPAALSSMGTLGSEPTAGVGPGGEVDVFWDGTNGDLWEGFSAGGTWNGPDDQGAGWNLDSGPSVSVRQGDGEQYVVWEGEDGGLHEGYWNGSAWKGALSLGMGPLGSSPAIGVHADGEQDVFWRGTNGDLWEAFSVGGTWYGPYDQGRGWGLDSAPAVAVDQWGDQYLFWQGANGVLDEAYWNGSAWIGPQSLGMGPLGSAPTAGIEPDGVEDVFWHGTNGDLWEANGFGGHWSGPFDVGPA